MTMKLLGLCWVIFALDSVHLISMATCGQEAPWRNEQRSLSTIPMSSSSRLKVCRMTNYGNITKLLTPIMKVRPVGSDELKTVGLYIKGKLDELGFSTEWDRFNDRTPYGVKTFRNLIATFDPLVHRRFILACHYDSKLESFDFLGATDSALPCALMLDIASTLAPFLHNRKRKDVTLQLLFFDGEEALVEWTETDSLYGSRHLAAKWETAWYPTTSSDPNSKYQFYLNKELDRIDVMVLLDLLGARSPRLGNYPHGAQDLFIELARLEQSMKSLGCLNNLQQMFYEQKLQGSGIEDDHKPFRRRGVKALHLIANPFPTVWHTRGDDWTALHRPTIENLASILRIFVAEYLGLNI